MKIKTDMNLPKLPEFKTDSEGRLGLETVLVALKKYGQSVVCTQEKIMNEHEILRNQISALTAERDGLKVELAEANDRAFCSTESHVRTMQKLHAAEKDRDIYATAVEDMAAAHKVECAALKAERDGWRESSEEMRMLSLRTADQRDALKDAARLALDVCIEMRRYGNQRSVAMAIGAEAALKAVL